MQVSDIEEMLCSVVYCGILQTKIGDPPVLLSIREIAMCLISVSSEARPGILYW